MLTLICLCNKIHRMLVSLSLIDNIVLTQYKIQRYICYYIFLDPDTPLDRRYIGCFRIPRELGT